MHARKSTTECLSDTHTVKLLVEIARGYNTCPHWLTIEPPSHIPEQVEPSVEASFSTIQE